MSTLLMSKDIPILEIHSNGNTILKNYDLLPINIRKWDVNIEDFYAEWITNRTISVNRTNAKAILNSLRISQTNSRAICKACHGVNLLDSYWIKDSEEKLTWKDVSLFQNSLTKSLAITALTGKVSIRENGRIHTPELTTQGVSAKAWWREEDSIFLYKVGKKELAASRILAALGVQHVKYEEVSRDRLDELVTDERKEFLKETGEKVVKCRLLTNEDRAMVSFEEFAVFCEYEGKNPYKEVMKTDRSRYYEMQVADFILSNDDRHIGNWGFFMDSNTGKLGGLYPLLDHDHAFSEKKFILSQTSDQEESLLLAAVKAQKHIRLSMKPVRDMVKPEEISSEQWNRVLENTDALSCHCRFMEQMEKHGYHITEKTVQLYEKIRRQCSKDYSLLEICGLYKNISDVDQELQKPIIELGNELKAQEAAAEAGLDEEGGFVRQGTSSVPAADAAIRRMIKETDGDSFEDMRSLQQDLTFKAASKEFSERKIAFGPAQMKTLGLFNTDGIYTNLGLLLSEQCIHTVKAAAFEGTDQSVFRDRREFSGSLLQQLNDVYNFIDMRNQTRAIFVKLRRIDERDYPEAAVREALLNSLVHRDYSFSASTLVSVYTDRIEFTTIGGLPAGVSLDDIMLGLSVCRNPKLANVFYRLELIEAYGTGIGKIMKSYENSGRQPVIETTDNAFKIVLPNRNEKAVKRDPENEQERMVLESAKKQGEIMRRDVEEALGMGQTAAGRLLKKMLEKGLLVKIGQGKNTQYTLPD